MALEFSASVNWKRMMADAAPTAKKRRHYRTIGEKRAIVAEAYAAQGLIKQTARKYNVEPSNIRRWRRTLVDSIASSEVPSHHRTLNLGPATLLPDLDRQLRDFIGERNMHDLGVSTAVVGSGPVPYRLLPLIHHRSSSRRRRSSRNRSET